MDQGSRNAAIAAAVILVGFGLAAYFLPTLIIWIGGYSTIVAAVVAAAFVAAFFLLFWWRGRSRGGD
ncbi:MAG: hypothetical protein KF723_17350 [Rhizobiaceae bacterium]|nr:hypothetical protein [Rhizobiaceae bacterium]